MCRAVQILKVELCSVNKGSFPSYKYVPFKSIIQFQSIPIFATFRWVELYLPLHAFG